MYKGNYWVIETTKDAKGNEVFIVSPGVSGVLYLCKSAKGKEDWKSEKELRKKKDRIVNVRVKDGVLHPISMKQIKPFQNSLAKFKERVEGGSNFKVGFDSKNIYVPSDGITLSLKIPSPIPDNKALKPYLNYEIEFNATTIVLKKYEKMVADLGSVNVTSKVCRNKWENECSVRFPDKYYPVFKQMADGINSEIKALQGVFEKQIEIGKGVEIKGIE